MISVKDFGAVGDGTTDDTAALNAAFSQTGRSIYLPAGSYLHGQLDPPVCAQIIGESEYDAILTPMAGVSTGLTIPGGEHYPSKLASFKIDGNNTLGATGLFLGQSAGLDPLASSVQMDGVRVLNFTGTGAIGVRVGNLLKSTVRKLTAESNTLNLLLEKVTDLLPTTVHFDSCVFNEAETQGAKLIDGWNILFTNCDFESSREEGTLLLPSAGGHLEQIIFDSCWWEHNHAAGTTAHQFVAGTARHAAGRSSTPACATRASPPIKTPPRPCA
ncbi:glycosyl hydrolase family 28-related protein [Sphingomonas leidyi]|uniref:glycosyl hydrolase family 28-related protein n=1 Tax=Sphingomonas leidyi TaxID=68569 RepID=UPI0036D2ECBB